MIKKLKVTLVFMAFWMLGSVSVWAGDKHIGVGVVKEVKNNTVTIAHGAIPTMNMGAMSMMFEVADPEMLQDLTVGAKIKFSFEDKKTVLMLTEFESVE